MHLLIIIYLIRKGLDVKGREKRPERVSLVGAQRLELPTLPSPFGDFNGTRKETRKSLFGGRAET